MLHKIMSEQPGRVFGWFLAALLILFVLMEGWRYAERPVVKNNPRQSQRALHSVSKKFLAGQTQLLDQTKMLANTLQRNIAHRHTEQDLYEILRDYPQFWGAGLYQANRPVVWNNFAAGPETLNDRPHIPGASIKIRKQGNVLLWVAHVGFKLQTQKGQIPYQLYTSKRIRQTNALPIGRQSEYNLLQEIQKPKLSTIHLGIYEPIPADTSGYRILHSLAGDSVGIVYATTNNVAQVKKGWQRTNRFWRAVFALFCFLVIGFLLYLLVDSIIVWKSLLIQLVIVGIGWLVFSQIHIAQDWLPPLIAYLPPERIRSYQLLCNAAVDSFFFLIIAATLQRKLPKLGFRLAPNAYFSSIFLTLGGAFLNVAGILITLNTCYHIAYATAIPLLSLQIFPSLGTLLFFLYLAIILLALSLTLIAINRFLLAICRNHHKLVTIFLTLSFATGMVISQLFISEKLILNWVVMIGLALFASIFLLSFLYEYAPAKLPTASALRNAAIYSFIISLAGSAIIYQAQIHQIDTELQNVIQNYSRQKDQKAEKLTSTLLSRLHAQFKNLEPSDFQKRIPFIQAQFTQIIKSTTANDNRGYSFDLQMVDSNQRRLAAYSTNLSSPDWVRDFNLARLRAVMNIQQISRQSARPIVQQPVLEDADDYQTFYRGWIPIFSSHQKEPLAWILCSIYREHPNLNKPMRAVMASLDYADQQNSYLVQEYQNDKLNKTIYQGIKTRFPVFNHLQPIEIQTLKKNSAVYYTSNERDVSYRNLLLKQSTDRVAKATTVLPGYQDIIFLFFRLSCSILIIGFVILYLYQSFRTGDFAPSKRDDHFRFRILDSFLLATLVFLILMVFVTHFAIKRQNREIVKQQLFEKLEPITQNATRQHALDSTAPGATLSLDSLTASLNVDASFYDDRQITRSTTPQIYRQHLLPSVLPYPVYHDLFLSQKRDALTTIHLDRQELLIGYRSILSAGGQPKAAVAIPTFFRSPKFNRQLLQTTSYLVILYLIIFGLFILASTLISRQLTRPLYHIRQGLQKISEGNLDTIIPVTSNDEVGNLAAAYNNMVRRLNELQKELAVAEREEAWKEMAQQVAHEIKNPLTPMKLNIQHLERQMASGDYSVEEMKQKVKKITGNIALQIQSLNNIASDFSQFSKPIDQEFTPLDVHQLIDSIVDLYDHDEQIMLETEKSALTTKVLGAEDELRRVIINLVKNAHEALGRNGTITLKTYVRDTSIFVEVRDTGKGISEEDKSKIFEPNFSTKTSGTGLGLAICKKVVQAHNGSISFASIHGEGTNFVIKLPLYYHHN